MGDSDKKKVVEQWVDISDQDINAVVEYMSTAPIACIDGGILKEFEESFSVFVGKKYAVAYSSGTAALFAAVNACGCFSGEKIILSEYSYVGTIYAALENRAKVVLVPYEEKTLNIDVHQLEEYIDSQTKAILITHTWGNPCDMDKIDELRRKYGVKIISDAAHAHGAEWKGKKIGGLSCEDISCFSLGKGKLITGGELGVAVTDDPILYDRLLMMGHPNRVPDALIRDEYMHYSNGFGIKLRPHVLSMVIGKTQLNKFEQKRKFNIKTNKWLEEKICSIPGYYKIHTYEGAARVYWKLMIALDKSFWGDWELSRIVQMLLEKGIRLEQFHCYDFKYEQDIENNMRYRDLLENVSNMNPPNNIIILPTMIQLDEESMMNIVLAFEEISKQRMEYNV